MKEKDFHRTSNECKTRWHDVLNEPSPALWKEEEDAELILSAVGSPSNTQGVWPAVSKTLMAKSFMRDHVSCKSRWKIGKPQTNPRRWSEAEDRELLRLTKQYTNKATHKYWEPISRTMESNGFHVTVADCRERYYYQELHEIFGDQGRR